MRDFLLHFYFLCLLGPAICWANPPPGTDLNSPESKWYEGAKTPDCLGCCSVADGQRVLARPDQESTLGWDVFLNGTWVPIPPDTRATQCSDPLNDRAGGGYKPLGPYPPHPTGGAVVWIYEGKIRCFSPPESGL